MGKTTFDYEIVKDPGVFEENSQKAHSDHICYKNRQEAEEGSSSYRLSLDGIWKFSYAERMDDAPHHFESRGFDCRRWADIRVPAHIQMEGYGVPQYSNTTYPWEGVDEIRPGEIPENFNPVADYVKYFTLPEEMKEEDIHIVFEGVESGFALWLNGSYVGYSEDSFDSREFDLTPYLSEGENKLAVRVWKWTSGSWCEDQDFFRFSGIFRSVWLVAIPKVHLEDIRVEALLNLDLSVGDLQIAVTTRGVGRVAFLLQDAEGNPVYTENIGIGGASWEESVYYVQGSIEMPKLWSAEEPNLYTLWAEVYDEEEQLVEVTRVLVGFRRFELVDGIMCLNGKRIVFKGVNRHEFNSVTGRVPDREALLLDIKTMKQNNINAIRTSHYPNQRDIYELCDIYGLYMIAENNLESHGLMDAVFRGQITEEEMVPGNRMEWLPMMLDRVNSCYQAYKNHPSILIWSCGNEARGGRVIYEMAEKFRTLDTHRLVHYEGIFHDRSYENTSDMESQMYPSVESIRAFLKEHPKKPFICCEYTHAMGNSCGAMHKYTRLSDTEPRYQGGFIWDYIDQSIYRKDRYGNLYLAYGGDFKDRPNDGNFSGNGICYGGERKPSPKMQEVKYNYQNITIGIDETGFTVRNQNLFLNLSIYEAQFLLEKEGRTVARTRASISLEPQRTETFALPDEITSVMKEWMGRRELVLTISFVLKEDTLWARAGHEVAFGQKVWKGSSLAQTLPKENARRPKLVRGWNVIGVEGDEFRALFSRAEGGMISYVYGGEEMLSTSPMPNFWRAPVDNDLGNRMPQRYAQWKIASCYASMRGDQPSRDTMPQVEEAEDHIRVGYTIYLPTTPKSSCRLTYQVYGDGTIRTTLEYDPVAELGDMPEFGMILKMNADYDTVEWYGYGPQETYADRCQGAKLGIYRNHVKDNLAEYLRPQECGGKCGVRYAKVTDQKGRGLLFAGEEFFFSALPYTPHEMEHASHPYELPQVHHTVIRIAKEQMGVGGDDSWGARVHPEYLLDVSGKKVFTFCFRGI